MSEDEPAQGRDAATRDAQEAGDRVASVDLAPEPADSALQQPPDDGAANAFLRRAQLAEDRLSEVLEAYRTLKKENDGHRTRVTRNLERRYEGRRERLLLRFIEILDNLDRALEAAETSFASSALVEGLILVRTQLLSTLKDEGLERIPVLGLPYDPNYSEAVQMAPTDDEDEHHLVVKELLRGYRLNGRVARPSRVVVAEYVAGGTSAAAPPVAGAATHGVAANVTPPFVIAVTDAPEDERRSEAELTLEQIVARAEAQAPSRPARQHAAVEGDGARAPGEDRPDEQAPSAAPDEDASDES